MYVSSCAYYHHSTFSVCKDSTLSSFCHSTSLSDGHRLSKPVKRRVRALKRLQYDFTKLEAEFYKEVQELEAKYAAMYQPLFDKVRLQEESYTHKHV